MPPIRPGAVIILDADGNRRLVTDDLADVLAGGAGRQVSELCRGKPRSPISTAMAPPTSEQLRVAQQHDGDLRAVVDALVAELVI